LHGERAHNGSGVVNDQPKIIAGCKNSRETVMDCDDIDI